MSDDPGLYNLFFPTVGNNDDMAHIKICDSIYYNMSSKCYLLALSKIGGRILQQMRNIKFLVKVAKISMEIYKLVVKFPFRSRSSSLFQTA